MAAGIPVAPYGFPWFLFPPLRATLFSVAVWIPMAPYGFLWLRAALFWRSLGDPVIPDGFLWLPMASPPPTARRTFSGGHLDS